LGKLAEFPTSFEEWENEARGRLSAEQFAYVHSGAGGGDAAAENYRALERWRIVPRALTQAPEQSISTEVLGVKLEAPMMLAPVRGLDYVRPRGQDLCAQAAAKCGVPVVLSNLASSSLEQVAKILGDAPRFFQLYPCADREVEQSILRRAEASRYLGLFLTVDMSGNPIQYRGPQTSEYLDYGNEVFLSDPVFQTRLNAAPRKDKKAALELIRKIRQAKFTWDDVDRIRGATKLPVVLKGILSPEDAKEAAERGVNGLVVSNHGGRAMSGEAASIDMLPEIIEASDMKLAVLYDGGIRSGTDILKALAIGAQAVLIGRAYIFALASSGEEGVISILKTMIREMKNGLATCGCSSVNELNRSFVRRFP
jgi:lactate 2-monooxygenase